VYTIHIAIQADDKFHDFPPEGTESAELTIESIVGSALLELFEDVTVDNVTVALTPSNIDIAVHEEKQTPSFQVKSINDAVKRFETKIKNKALAEPFSSKRVKSVVLEREASRSSSIVNEAAEIARNRSIALRV